MENLLSTLHSLMKRETQSLIGHVGGITTQREGGEKKTDPPNGRSRLFFGLQHQIGEERPGQRRRKNHKRSPSQETTKNDTGVGREIFPNSFRGGGEERKAPLPKKEKKKRETLIYFLVSKFGRGGKTACVQTPGKKKGGGALPAWKWAVRENLGGRVAG